MYCSSCVAVLDPLQTACSRCGRPVEGAPASPALAVHAAGNTRPGAVRLAAILLLFSAAATPLSWLMFFARSPNAHFQASAMLQTLGFVVLWFVIIAFLLRGQAWARIATLLRIVWFFGN